MPTDFRDGMTFPRRGRMPLGRFLWLARVFDKARASSDGTIHDYIYPCPMDLGMMERWGIRPADFDGAVVKSRDDEAILRWAQSTINEAEIDRANSWLVVDKFESLDRQDQEES